VKIRFWNLLFTAIAIGVGVVTLLGYFVELDVLLAIRLQFVAWASLLAAVAVWVGAFNLLGVHSKRTLDQSPGWYYSPFLILGLVLAVGAGFVGPFVGWGSGPTNAANVWVFRYIQTAVGTTLSGLLVFFLVFAGYRLLRRRASLTAIVFVVVAVISLAGMAPLPAGLPDIGVRDVWIWLAQVPAVAGARGLLIGIALGIVATGLRLLLAVDRPYGD
jgi:hypothetical protein